MGWLRKFHCTCDGCGRAWLDGALTKGAAEKAATDGGWSTTTNDLGLTRHWCSSCTPDDTGKAAA